MKNYELELMGFEGKMFYACYDRYIVFCGHDKEGYARFFTRRLYKGKSYLEYFFTF